MENFANEFVSKLDGKISDEALRTVFKNCKYLHLTTISTREKHM